MTVVNTLQPHWSGRRTLDAFRAHRIRGSGGWSTSGGMARDRHVTTTLERAGGDGPRWRRGRQGRRPCGRGSSLRRGASSEADRIDRTGWSRQRHVFRDVDRSTSVAGAIDTPVSWRGVPGATGSWCASTMAPDGDRCGSLRRAFTHRWAAQPRPRRRQGPEQRAAARRAAEVRREGFAAPDVAGHRRMAQRDRRCMTGDRVGSHPGRTSRCCGLRPLSSRVLLMFGMHSGRTPWLLMDTGHGLLARDAEGGGPMPVLRMRRDGHTRVRSARSGECVSP